MRNKCSFKILHGCDSLDLPYMYDILFKGDKDTIFDFTSRIIDTRFLCEYYRASIEDEKKCSIYDALLYFETINMQKFEYLNNTHDYMGPVQDISWNIHKMSSHHVKYALYDVLFLKHFLSNIYSLANKNTPHIYKSYYLFIQVRYSQAWKLK